MFTKQSTLNNFCDFLPAARPLQLGRALEWELEPKISDKRYTVLLTKKNIIEIEEMHCKDCGSLLYHNGYNPKLPVLDNGLGKRYYRVHRKRCPRCGEISPDYSALAPYHGQYHENYKRRSRQHYMNGQNIPRIQETIAVDFNILVPYTTLHGWIEEIDEPLHEFVSTTLVPYSGHWHHDETFLRIGGRKAYALSTIDEITGFLAPPTISFKNNKTAARKHLNAAKRPGKTRVLSMVTDGTSTIAPLFKTRYLKDTQRQQGITHFKWRISRKLRKLAGISERSVKPLPQEYRTFQWLFYHVLDSRDQTHAYFCIERLRPVVMKASKKYLTTLFNDMEGKLSQITAWQRNPAIARTNNKSENSHQQFSRHRSFKARCMVISSAQRIADLTFLRYNRLQLNKHVKDFQARRETFEGYWMEKPRDPTLRGGHVAFRHEEKRLKRVTGEFNEFWESYMSVKR